MKLTLATAVGILCATLATGACNRNDARLGGGDAAPPVQDGNSNAEVSAAVDGAGGSAGGAGGSAGGTGGGGGGAAGSDASAPDASFVSCTSNPTAAEGSPCASEGAECSLCGPSATCCREFLFCQSGKWIRLEAGPCQEADAAVFSCGTKTCSATEFCKHSSGGPRPPPGTPPAIFYECAPIPARCSGPASCACVVPYLTDAGAAFGINNICNEANPASGIGFAGCSDDGAGRITVTCALP